MKWSTACKDWEKRIVSRGTLVPFDPLFPDEAESALAVYNALKIVDAPGSPTMGEVSRKWIIDFVSSIFGSYDPETGRRLITEYFLLISKKNSKSTSAAGIMMTALVRNWRESAEFLILAPTVEIANNSYYPARDMVKKDEELSALFQVQDHVRTITHRVTGAMLKVVAADSEAVSGKKATGVLIDELWLFGKKHNAENMLREACGGLASRPEGFTIFLSTQSDEPPAGVFRQKLAYARDVRDGKIEDNRFLPVIYEFPERMIRDKKYLEVENFYITNPNLGASVDNEFIARELKKAQNDGAESMVGFLSKHLNVEIGMALRTDNWPGAPFWDENTNKKITFEAILDRCEVVDVGIDGGGLDDLLGFNVTGRDKNTHDWLTWSHAWAHPSVLERRKSEAPRFRDFEKDGDLTLSVQMGDDVLEVADYVARIENAGILDKVGVDPAGIGGVLDALVAAGVPQDKVIGISQGWKLSGAIKTTERKLAEGALLHNGSRLMAWCVGNAKVEPKGNAMLITKQASGTAKIDPLMALFSSIALISLNPEAMNAYSGELRVIEA
jgi:phage terminase large subunit-like protein